MLSCSTLAKTILSTRQFDDFSAQHKEIMKRGYHGGSKDGQKIIRIYDKDAPGVIERLMEQWKAEGRQCPLCNLRSARQPGRNA